MPEITEFFRSGPTTFFASQVDQRFSYCLYVPKRREGDPDRYPLVVLQHSTARDASDLRDAFADFCELNRAAVFAPLFPAGIGDPDDIHNYKFLEYGDIRFDLLLLDMIDEASQVFPIDAERFLLHGFSGGAQFVQRFLFLHPHRLIAASVGAAGRYTMIDDTRGWWLGTADTVDRFGIAVDPGTIATVPIQLVVGSVDVETWETLDRTESNWTEGLEQQGDTRVERIHAFQRNLSAHGISSQLDVIPNVAHHPTGILPAVKLFFSDMLREHRTLSTTSTAHEGPASRAPNHAVR
jgi:hypothetical protein